MGLEALTENGIKVRNSSCLSRTQVKMAVLDDIKYIHTTIKPRTSINRVIRVNGKNLQYTVFRLCDNNLNVGRIHEK